VQRGSHKPVREKIGKGIGKNSSDPVYLSKRWDILRDREKLFEKEDVKEDLLELCFFSQSSLYKNTRKDDFFFNLVELL
jgi:hypothetical protein